MKMLSLMSALGMGNEISPMLGMIGLSGSELIIIFFVLCVMAMGMGLTIVLVIYFNSKGTRKSDLPPAQPPIAPASPTPASKCPRCGAAMSPGSTEGLCPRCLMSMNLGAPTDLMGDVGPQGTRVVAQPTGVAPAPGDIAKLFPQFEILECLGRGGMGAVYKARQLTLDRYVALKILLPERQAGAQFTERFAREARALARLNHPAIVTVYDFGEAGGYPYLIMEYVDGLSLRQLLQQGKLLPEKALAIVPKICEALQFAHQQGIVHRDIKPENILLDKQGQVKIADFGIAKILAPGAQEMTLTGGKDVVGTPHYMAPEQVEQPAKVDHRADIFSLGVVFYEMLTGELPLGKFQLPSQKAHTDARLDEVVMHALEKEPDRRYQQASQVKSDVETISGSPTASVAPVVPVAPPPFVAAQPATASPFPSRLSRTAIAGAVWSCISVVAVFCALGLFSPVVVTSGQTPIGIAWWQVLLMVTLLPLGLISPIGTTILGWVAVSQIRRSAGRVYGLGLALYDGLLFPLLALDGVIAMVAARVLYDIRIQGRLAHEAQNSPMSVLTSWGIPVFAFVIIVVADLLIIWWAWKAAVKPVGDASQPRVSPTEISKPKSDNPVRDVLAVVGIHCVLFLAALAFVSAVIKYFVQPFYAWGVVLPPVSSLAIGFLHFFGRFWFLAIPLLLLLDVIACSLLRHFGGLRWCRRWAVGGAAALIIVVFAVSIALVVPINTLTAQMKTSVANNHAVHSSFPESVHIGFDNHSVMVQHDKVDLHHVIYYKGSFGSSTRGSHNERTMTWIEDTTIQLKNGRTFEYLRKSESPNLLSVNGRQYNLLQGCVILLRDDGTEEQLELFPSLNTARNPEELAKLIAAKRQQEKRRGTNAEPNVQF